MEIKRYLLVQWLSESRFGKTKFAFQSRKGVHVCGCTRTGHGAVSKCVGPGVGEAGKRKEGGGGGGGGGG